MRTLLSQFCDEFEAILRPVLDPLHGTTETLARASEGVSARAVLPSLRDLRHQLQVVAEKVAEQQAFVLIFGPLKSGKSTLMNAVAASYVSEVTSLPAYPCMNFVSHADSKEFVVTRYDGKQETFSNLNSLSMVVSRAHNELAAEIRRAEDRGVEFEAQEHYPAAIRRIDVRLPAGELGDSGAVLVDTPGLYTRMKFGYDRMTREFRDTAACAIFVVKSENLFLEQVFEEFNQLLSLFSRIFLVVNLDTTKQDLRPDGSLEPSLEAANPLRIIEAFESLAMSAPIKLAAEEGRLRIYPVDLLRAASRRIRGLAADGPVETYEGQADFDAFLGDLTEYLNSTDYLVAFLSDSIRRATGLLGEIREQCHHPTVVELEGQVCEVRATLERVEREGEVLDRLRALNWNERLVQLRDNIKTTLREQGREVLVRTRRQIAGTIQAWFQEDGSLSNLVEDDLQPLFDAMQHDHARAVELGLDARLAEGAAGLELEEGELRDLSAAGVDLAVLGRMARFQVDTRKASKPPSPDINLEVLPVRRGFWDWILFRSLASVRRRLFGAGQRPTTRIPARVKTRRLGDAGCEALQLLVDEQLDIEHPGLQERLITDLFGGFSTHLHDSLRSELDSKSEDNRTRWEALVERLDEIAHVRDSLADLDQDVLAALDSMVGLSSVYGQAEPSQLVQAVAGSDDDVEAEALEEITPAQPPQPTVHPSPAPKDSTLDAPAERAHMGGGELAEIEAELNRSASHAEALEPAPPAERDD